jgi:hypothetical protein
MKPVLHRPALLFVALAFVFGLGCSDRNVETPVANGRAESYEPREAPVLSEDGEAPVLLEDGVYPVVPDDEAEATSESEFKTVELENVPVEGSTAPYSDAIRVVNRPLVLFRNEPHFSFKFAKNECTEIGFANTDELRAYTRDHVGSRLAVVIDNKVITKHKIREVIESDKIRITCCTVGGGDHLHKHLTKLAAKK